jgi:hypothetical protein
MVCGAVFVFLERPFMNRELTARMARALNSERLRLGSLVPTDLWNRG